MGPANITTRKVLPGTYEIRHVSLDMYLDALEDPIYNGKCDDCLVLRNQPSRQGKWELTAVGDGFTIKQVSSGLYCAVANGEQFLKQHVVLSPVPTVWSLNYYSATSDFASITWSVSGNLAWEATKTKTDHIVIIGTLPIDESKAQGFVWQLRRLGPSHACGKLQRGLYSIQSFQYQEFLSMTADERHLGCWPKTEFKDHDTKLWYIEPLGNGYSIRLHGTDKYCTLMQGMRDGAPVCLTTYPSAWRIEHVESTIRKGIHVGYCQIYWGKTRLSWGMQDMSWDQDKDVDVVNKDVLHPIHIGEYSPQKAESAPDNKYFRFVVNDVTVDEA